MSIVKKILIVLLLLIVLLIGAVAGLLGTQSGLQFVIKMADRWVPGLSISQSSGSLRNLTLTDIGYEMQGVSVKAGEFDLSLNLSCLTSRKLCIDDVKVENVNVVVNTQEMPPSAPPDTTSEPLTDLQAPLPIQLTALSLENITVNVDGTAISLGEFKTGASWEGRALTLQPTKITALLVALPKVVAATAEDEAKAAKDAAAAEPEKPLGEMLKALFEKPLLDDFSDIKLPLDITATEIVGEGWRVTRPSSLSDKLADAAVESVGDVVEQITDSKTESKKEESAKLKEEADNSSVADDSLDILIERLQISAITKDADIQIKTFDVRSPQGNLSLQGLVSLDKKWPVNLALNSDLNIEPIKGEKIVLDVTGALKDKVVLGLKLDGPLNAQLDAETELGTAGLPLSLTLQSNKLQWPLTGESEYQVDDLRLKLDGKATDYSLSFRSAVKGKDLPPAKITLDGKGTEEQFKLAKLRLAALEGNADLSATVDWSKAISWNSLLTLDGINTVKQWPEWPAKIQGKITTRGSLYGGSWQLAIPDIQLNGNVKQNQLKVVGSASGNQAGQWKIPGLNIALGKNVIEAKGDLSNKWNLDASINAPHLDGALPGLGGVAKGTIKLRGELKAPQLLADLTASNLRWQALSVAQVKVKGDVSSADQVKGDLSVRVEQLKQDALQVKLLTLDAKGTEKQHKLNLNLEGEPVSGRLALEGGFDRTQERWKGTLSNTKFDTPVGEWLLQRNIALDYRNKEQKVSISAHCWRNPNAELCVPKTIDAGASGEASVVLNRFDLAMIKEVLPPETKLSGVFTGKADVSWKADGSLPQAKVSLVGNGVKVQQTMQDKALPIGFDTLTLNANMAKGKAELEWLIKIANNGQFSGKLQVADPEGRRNLSGTVNIDRFSLALIKPLLALGEDAKGMLNANLRLGGNVQSPALFGRLALTQVDIDGKFMPFDLTDGELAVNFNGATSTLEGLLRTTQGQINLSGDADWRNIDAWRAKIAAKGDKFRITVPPMVRMDLSPDLVFEASPKMFNLNGKVDIPWARITVQELPESAVSVSSDEVMLDAQLKPIAPKTASIPINSNLIVNIGQDVLLDAFGLQARLQGDLKVAQDKRGLGLNGQIDIPSGRFHAYGQDLVIRKGNLIFSGPPDQPLLNIEAIRNPESTENDVTAGVKVTGLADNPKLEVFSDPAMSQQEALSYLVRGQGLDATGDDAGMMTSMLIGMGVSKSGKLVGKIGEAFGVSNLSLDTKGAGDNSQIVVSGYILPGLQVKYGVGIFDSLATLTLRYRLMPKLYLEAVSGVDQALDVLYQFEF